MTEKIKKLFRNKYFPFIALGGVYFIISFLFPITADDLRLNTQFGSLIDQTKLYYQAWSSRIILIFFILILLKIKLLWVFLNAFFVAFCAYMFNYLFWDAKNVKSSWLACALVAIYPFIDIGTAGYITCSVVYFWSALFMFAAFVPLKKACENKSLAFWEYPLYVFSAVYAGNQEQSAAIMIAVYVLFILLRIIKKEKIRPFVLVMFFTAVAGLIFLFLAPGSHKRLLVETQVWFQDFFKMSLFDRAELALTSALYQFIFKPSAVFLAFYATLVLVIWRQKNNIVQRIIAAVAGIIVLVFGYFSDFGRDAMTKYGIADSMALFLLLIAAFCVAYSVLFAFQSRQKGALALYALLLGLGSRMALMFSPTIWGSQTRTYLFMNFAFIAVTMMLFAELDETKFSKWKIVYVFIGILAFITLIVLLLHISAPQDSGLLFHAKNTVKNIIEKYDIIGWEMAVRTISR